MNTSASTLAVSAAEPAAPADSTSTRPALGWPGRLAVLALLMVLAMAVLAPLLATTDPLTINPGMRLRDPGGAHWLGTDPFGRDVYSRLIWGSRMSLAVGVGVVLVALGLGLPIGVMAGYFKSADAVLMRVMDGMMAVPAVLLAIALVALSGSSLATVMVAIAVPEVPRVVRMVRGVILSVRTEPFVEAAASLGTRLPAMIWRHIIPSTVAPLLVLGTYIFASAIMTEAVLSFLGAGLPPEHPSWGTLIADGRSYFMLKPGIVLYPGIVISVLILSVNVLGDALRDRLDPRLAQRV